MKSITTLFTITSLVPVAPFAPFLHPKKIASTSVDTTTHTTSSSSLKSTYYTPTTTTTNSQTYINNINNNLPSSMGEADVAFRKGNDLEQQGLFRTAHAAYHEAATLYQCYLDQDVRSYEFSHVTDLDSNDDVAGGESDGDTSSTDTNTGTGTGSCRKYLAETCMRLAFLSSDSLGDPRAAIRLYKEAARIDPEPNVFAYDGIGNSIEASFPGSLKDAIQAYQKALEIEDNDLTRFHLGVALERLCENSDEIFDKVRRSDAICASLVDSWGYIRYVKRDVL